MKYYQNRERATARWTDGAWHGSAMAGYYDESEKQREVVIAWI